MTISRRFSCALIRVFQLSALPCLIAYACACAFHTLKPRVEFLSYKHKHTHTHHFSAPRLGEAAQHRARELLLLTRASRGMRSLRFGSISRGSARHATRKSLYLKARNDTSILVRAVVLLLVRRIVKLADSQRRRKSGGWLRHPIHRWPIHSIVARVTGHMHIPVFELHAL